jgi:hypothetical protein
VDERGEEAGADALEDADAERAGRSFRERGHVRSGRIETSHDRVGVAQEKEARFGRLDTPRPARPMEELLPDDAFELRDLLTHGRLRVAELARRGAERPRPRNRLEGREVAQFYSQPIISAHDRYER